MENNASVNIGQLLEQKVLEASDLAIQKSQIVRALIFGEGPKSRLHPVRLT